SDAVPFLVCLDQRRWNGRAAGLDEPEGRDVVVVLVEVVQEVDPDGRDAGRHGDALALDQLADDVRVGAGAAREHRLGPGQAAGVWETPPVRMEHRNN